MCHISNIQTASSELPAFIFVGSVPRYRRGQTPEQKKQY